MNGALTGTEAVGGRAKRVFDLLVAVPATILLAPVMIGIAVWIRRDSPGPALFRQRRVGLHGREFRVFKFRTMVVDAEHKGTGLAVQADDDRITGAGHTLRRLSLDELPQLLNVLRGEMSIVGPRPTVPSQVTRYTPEQMGRLDARPGITGLAQVRGRATLPWSQRIAIDLEYIRDWSMMRDLGIIARTFLVVLRPADTYKGETGGFDLPPGPTDEDDQEVGPSQR